MHRIFIGVLAAAMPFAGMLNAAYASTPAEAYIQANVERGLSILNDKTLSPDQSHERFRAFLETLTDIKRVALFTLGPAAATAPAADVDDFVAAFHQYAVAEYEQLLSEYSGQTVNVTGSTERAPGDFIVDTAVADPQGSGTEVDFRVNGDNGHYSVLDVSVHGAWLAIEERAQFAGFLSQHGNDIKALTVELRRRAQAMRP